MCKFFMLLMSRKGFFSYFLNKKALRRRDKEK